LLRDNLQRRDLKMIIVIQRDPIGFTNASIGFGYIYRTVSAFYWRRRARHRVAELVR
jgi:hypothetical protein